MRTSIGLLSLVIIGLAVGCQETGPGDAPQDLGTDGPVVEKKLRSALYPEDWTPSFRDAEGRFLSDFSYAGYKNGEVEIPDLATAMIFNAATQYGADATGNSDATAAIQAAFNAAGAAGGGVVLLPEGTYRCDGLLEVRQSNVVLRGAGPGKTKLYFTKWQNMTDVSHLTMRGTLTSGPSLPLVEEGGDGKLEVRIADAASINVGDDVSVGWVITPEFIAEHKMTGTWTVFLNQWKPFFRRKVIAVDRSQTPHRVTVDVPLRYPAKLRDQPALRRETGYLTGVGVESLSIADSVAWADAWKSLRAHAIGFTAVKDGWIRDVQSFVPPTPGAAQYHLQNGGLIIKDSKRVTVDKVQLENAQNRGDGGCGYLFELMTSNEVLIRDSVARNGRHNFIQNWDFGSTGLVFLRCRTEGSAIVFSVDLPITYPAASEYHHSLTMACLVDSAIITDTWAAQNRLLESSGAGHTATRDVFWNSRSGNTQGSLKSYQYGWGYVIGTKGLSVETELGGATARGTEPEDFVEHLDRAEALDPPSLYDDQLKRRLDRGERLW